MSKLFNWLYIGNNNELTVQAPAKKGIALLFQIFSREFWNLIKLNCIFLLFCVPVITIGAAYTAMVKLIFDMIEDKPIMLFSDFLDAFKKNFKMGTISFLILLVCNVSCIAALIYYIEHSAAQPILYVLVAACAMILFVLMIAGLYLIPIQARVHLKFKNIVRNAVLVSLVFLGRSVLALLVLLAAVFMMVWYSPFTLIFLLMGILSMTTLIILFIIKKGVRSCIKTDLKKTEEA